VRAVFDDVNLFKGKQVINYEDFVNFSRLILVLAVQSHFDILLSSVLKLYLKPAT